MRRAAGGGYRRYRALLGGAGGVALALYVGPFLPHPKVWPQAAARLAGAGALRAQELMRLRPQDGRPLLLPVGGPEEEEEDAEARESGEYGCLSKDALVSVIIPVHNEGAAGLEKLLSAVYASTSHKGHVELVLVNAACSDDSFAALETLVDTVPNVRRVAVCFAKGGRGPALRAGARVARGDVLLFLHADTRLPNGYDDLLRRRLGDPSVLMSAFAFGIDRSQLSSEAAASQLQGKLGRVEAVANMRAQYLWLPYGDQALAATRANYERLGGFQPLAMMEDFEFSARARQVALSTGQSVLVMEDSVALCSPRRWEGAGVGITTLRNWLFVAAFVWGGVPPETIFKWYYGKSS